VILGLLEQRIKEIETPPQELLVLRRRLMGARTRSRHHMAEALMDLDIADLRRDLRRLLARGADNVFTVLARIREVRENEGARVQKAFEEIGDRFEPVLLHRIRIRARRLRYTAEISDAIKQTSSDAPQRFKELQDLLGRVQDAFVLSGWLEQAAQRAEARGEQAVASEARRQAKWALELSRRRHRKLLERDPSALLQNALEAMGQSRPSAA
jgi:CHAD domain-containing protein